MDGLVKSIGSGPAPLSPVCDARYAAADAAIRELRLGADGHLPPSESQREHHLLQAAVVTRTIRPSSFPFLLQLARGRPYDLMRPVIPRLQKCIYRRLVLLPKRPARDSTQRRHLHAHALFPCRAIKAKQPFEREALAQLSDLLFHGVLCIANSFPALLHTPLLNNQSLASKQQR